MNDASPSPARRPGGRSARIQDAVFSATLRLLETAGAAALSVKLIAAEAGVAESTVYRRWGSLAGVIAGTLAELAVVENPIPDNGSLAADFHELLRNVADIIERPAIRRVFRFAMSLDDADADALQVRNTFWSARFAAGTAIVNRAVERGEIALPDDPQAVIEALVGPLYVRTFLLERPITDVAIDESVKMALLIARGPTASDTQEARATGDLTPP